MKDLQTHMWAITAYYNPVKYKNRYRNFKIFRDNLKMPLVVVELSIDGTFELNESDADILVQVKSNSILWHKERLLNIALKYVPTNIPYIAWLDCDIIISNPNWQNMAIEKLKENCLVQLFSYLIDLRPDTLPDDMQLTSEEVAGYSIAYLNESNHLSDEDFRPSVTQSMRRCLFGLAWAAKRTIIEQTGFYDVMVIGSGDRALACAGYGRFEDAISTTLMSKERSKHYLYWAKKFYNLVNKKITFLDIKLYHLWHGELSNRHYIERHHDFSKFDFDPSRHLVLNSYECWEWNGNDEKFQTIISSYLVNRREDGE